MQTLNNAAPRIAADLNGMALYSWSVSIPSLGLAIGTILAGKLSDIYGRRAIMLGSTFVFILGAILSSLSPTFMTLIAARTLLCLGQGAVAPLCFAVVGDMFVGGARSKWIGLLNVPFGVPALFGPTLSGWMVDALSWRHIFWWSLPLLLLCLVFAYGMPPLIQGAAHKIDVARRRPDYDRIIDSDLRSLFCRNNLSLGIRAGDRPACSLGDLLGAVPAGRVKSRRTVF